MDSLIPVWITLLTNGQSDVWRYFWISCHHFGYTLLVDSQMMPLDSLLFMADTCLWRILVDYNMELNFYECIWRQMIGMLLICSFSVTKTIFLILYKMFLSNMNWSYGHLSYLIVDHLHNIICINYDFFLWKKNNNSQMNLLVNKMRVTHHIKVAQETNWFNEEYRIRKIKPIWCYIEC